jgi:hypothetical protein
MSPYENFDHSLIGAFRSNRNLRLHLPLAAGLVLAGLAACAPAPAASGGSAGGAASPAAATAPAATVPSAPAGGGLVSGACANPLYPVALNASWSYHGSGGSLGDYEYTETVTAVSADGFVQSAAFSGLTREVNWKCTDLGLELLSPGASGSVGTSSMNAVYTSVDSTGVTLPTHVAAGDEWTQTLKMHGENSVGSGTPIPSDTTVASSFKAVGEESVTVPAGTFQAMRIDVTSAFDIVTSVEGMSVPVHFTITGSVWYAPGVGMIKTTSVIEGVESSVELTAYTIP